MQTLVKLRFSDLIYLLNILKLQRSKSAEKMLNGQQDLPWEEAREQWVNDLQLALSVAVSAEDRESKDTNKIARILIEKVEACRNDKFAVDAQNKDLRYEHFIGPLVIICATNGLVRA